MFKNILLSFCFVTFMLISSINSQNNVPLSVKIDTVELSFEVDKNDEYQDVSLKNSVTNISDQAVSITWFFNNSDAGAWEFAICDKVSCYFPGADGKTFTLDPAEEGEFTVHLYPRKDNSISSATVTGILVNTDDPNTDSFYVHHEFTNTGFKTSTPDFVADQIDINVFPNPAHDYVTIKSNINLGNIDIQTITGKTIKNTMTTASHAVLNISDLPKGLYIVQAFDVFGSQVKAVKLYKR